MKLTLVFDVLALAGFGVAFAGLWWIWPPAALVICGLPVCALGVWGAWRARH